MKTIALGKVAKIDRNKGTEDECKSLPYIGLEHVEKETGGFIDGFVPTPQNMLATNFKFTKKHVLYGKLRPYLNKVVLPNFDGVCTTEILPILPDPEKLDRGYLWGLMLTPKFVKWASLQVSGANLPRLSPNLLATYEIPLPPLPEQKRIAAQLAQADRLRQLRRNASQLGESYLQSAFLAMFGDPETNSKGWEKPQLKKYVKVQGGFSFKSGDFRKSGVKVVKITNVHFDRLAWNEVEHLPEIYLEKYSDYSLHKDDIVVALTRPIIKSLNSVKVCKVRNSDLPALLNQRVGRLMIKNSQKVHYQYLLQLCYLPYFRKQVESFLSESLQPNISINQVGEIPIPIPPLPEQERFAQIVARYEKLRSQMHESTRQAELLFQGLLWESFG